MVSSPSIERDFSSIVPAVLASILIAALVSSCGGQQRLQYDLSQLPPFDFDAVDITSEQALLTVEDYDVLAVSPLMTDYFDRYISRLIPQQQRARMLHTMLLSPAFLGVGYQRESTFTAQQVFSHQSANCIAFASTYIALARHYGLDARFQLLKKLPEWNRQGDMVSMDIHVNSKVRLSRGGQLTVDIGSGKTDQSGRSIAISDKAAMALFYNNLAMAAFSRNNSVEAYGLIVKAIQLAPEQDLLWSNIGALFRKNAQYKDAETVYRVALAINPDSYTAANNLAVLYQRTGQQQQFAFYYQKIKELQRKNPYYHYWLARQDEKLGDYRAALIHIARAISLKSDEWLFIDFQSRLIRQPQLEAISSVNSLQTSSGLKASIHADIARSLSSSVQRLP